jgi:hypothetical protein
MLGIYYWLSRRLLLLVPTCTGLGMIDAYDLVAPALRELAPGHRVAWHYAAEIGAGTITARSTAPDDVAEDESAATVSR